MTITTDKPPTYKQLEQVLTHFGFEKHRIKGYVAFTEKAHNATVALPVMTETSDVLPRHLSAARAEITGMGVADELQFETAINEALRPTA